jgi:hypothetical protein
MLPIHEDVFGGAFQTCHDMETNYFLYVLHRNRLLYCFHIINTLELYNFHIICVVQQFCTLFA